MEGMDSLKMDSVVSNIGHSNRGPNQRRAIWSLNTFVYPPSLLYAVQNEIFSLHLTRALALERPKASNLRRCPNSDRQNP